LQFKDAPERLLHIGDNLDRDVLSPQRLGAKALLYRPKGKKKAEAAGCEPERGVNSIDSIKEFLQLFPGES
jgi:FMN phosphatase YigB (HAD superfamily)